MGGFGLALVVAVGCGGGVTPVREEPQLVVERDPPPPPGGPILEDAPSRLQVRAGVRRLHADCETRHAQLVDETNEATTEEVLTTIATTAAVVAGDATTTHTREETELSIDPEPGLGQLPAAVQRSQSSVVAADQIVARINERLGDLEAFLLSAPDPMRWEDPQLAEWIRVTGELRSLCD